MKIDINKDLMQNEKPSNKWLCKDVANKDIIRTPSPNVSLPLSAENEEIMKKLIDFVRYSQDPTLNKKDNEDYLRPAVGLAAPQIGSNTNMFFARFEYFDDENDESIDSDAEEFAMVNAKITEQSTQLAVLPNGEGCLSVDRDVPGFVPRSYKIKVTGYNWLKKEEVNLTLRGYRAIVFQHEIEHNHGKLYYDKIDKSQPKKMNSEWIVL